MDGPDGFCFDPGVSAEITEAAFRDLCRRAGLDPESLEPVACLEVVATLAIDPAELVGAAS
jgi:hypothetical protein